MTNAERKKLLDFYKEVQGAYRDELRYEFDDKTADKVLKNVDNYIKTRYVLEEE